MIRRPLRGTAAVARVLVWAGLAAGLLGARPRAHAEEPDPLLSGLIRCCTVLDELHLEWTELTRSSTDASFVSLRAHALWSHAGRALHTRWEADASKALALAPPERPSDAEWDRLDALARQSAPTLDFWDGVRHTRYAQAAPSKPYVVSALRAREDHRFSADHLEGLLYYVGFRIDGLGAGWQRVSSQGGDGSPRRAYGAPEACFYLSFGAESPLPRWSVLWNEPWKTAQATLDAASAADSLRSDPRLSAGDEVLAWAPEIQGLPRLPLLARHVRPHVKQILLTRLRHASPLPADEPPLDVPAELEGAQQVFWDEITNEGFVVDAKGQRHALHPPPAKRPGTEPVPPPRVPTVAQPSPNPGDGSWWRRAALLLGSGLLVVAVVLRVRAARRT